MSKGWLVKIIDKNNPGLPPDEVLDCAQAIREEYVKRLPREMVTPTADCFDSADYEVPIEVEAYNNGFNQCLKQVKEIINENTPSG